MHAKRLKPQNFKKYYTHKKRMEVVEVSDNTPESQNDNPRVLVGCPTYLGMRYCLETWLLRMKQLTYPLCNILIVDNSADDSLFIDLQKKKAISVIRDDCTDTKRIMRLVHSRNMILEYAMANNYDYVLMMDQDVIPPANIIEELLSCKKDMVSGIYFNYFLTSGEVKYLPVAQTTLTDEEFLEVKHKLKLSRGKFKSGKDILRHLFIEEVERSGLLKVTYACNGCMLISKKVFEKVRYGTILGRPEASDDIYFFNMAKEAGFECYCYTKIKCDHLILNKYVKGKDDKFKNPLFE